MLNFVDFLLLVEVEGVDVRAPTRTGWYGKIFPYGFRGEFMALIKLALPMVSKQTSEFIC